MRRLLAKGQHQVTVAFNGIACLQELDRGTFDVVLMDVQMPELGGFETTAEIRRGEQQTGRHMPIVAMTAHAMKGDRERCLESGMDDYVSKPIQASELFAALDRVRSALPLDEAIGQEAAKEVVEDDAIDWAAVLESVADDVDLLRELVSILLAEMPQWLRDLRQAIEQSDAELLRRTAHTVKGSLGQVGSVSGFRIAERLEIMGANKDFTNAAATLAELERALTDRICPALKKRLETN